MKTPTIDFMLGVPNGYSCAFRNWQWEDSRLQCATFFFVLRFKQHEQLTNEEVLQLRLWIEEYLNEVYQKTTIISHNDPALNHFRVLEGIGACDLRFVNDVEVSKFVRLIFEDIGPTSRESTNGKIELFEVQMRAFGRPELDQTFVEVVV